jgi:Ca2+-binding RTX toxin-like protein
MIQINIRRLVFVVLVALIILSVVSAFAANIVVPTTHLTNQAQVVTANTLKPSQCSAITLTTVTYCPVGGGICNGSNANELIIGSPNIDTIQGKGGDDCIVGGGGNDDITGSQAKDVCIGGPGIDTFSKCETVIQ